uniref:40S ribosomal protein S11 N-terminal domain-containing protein n=1 Tax=Brassica oleracea var. oleracea TaxID=109376 RepID=A0A0D3BQX4_BRAOL
MRCFSTAEVRLRPGMSSDIRSGEQEQPVAMAEQTEKAFLKQPNVFLSSKKSGKGKRPGKGENRFWKNFGRILAGTCHSAKMQRTIIVCQNYLHFVKKYQRYEKRHSNISAHVSPCFRVKEGDHVIIGQCRPLSKTVRFNVLKVIPAGASAFAKKLALLLNIFIHGCWLTLFPGLWQAEEVTQALMKPLRQRKHDQSCKKEEQYSNVPIFIE